ncbi:MAG: potassium channel family protein [Candidatus Hodarchaeales archaeon]
MTSIQDHEIAFIETRIGWLFFSYVILLILFPFLMDGDLLKGILWQVVFSFTLVIGIYTISYNRTQIIISLLLGIPTLILGWLAIFNSEDILVVSAHGVIMAFYLFIIYSIFRYVSYATEVTKDVLYAACAVYMLLGGFWASLYFIIETIVPGSFLITTGDSNESPDFIEFVYFSFITLTTLGYGDILPANSYSRIFVALEGIAGVLYVAILIARLVGMYAQEK